MMIKKNKLVLVICWTIFILLNHNLRAANIALEAESFSIGNGWEITDRGYTSVPNLWSAKKIVADESDLPAICSKMITIAESGNYNLWVHYESCYGFGSRFGIQIKQQDKIVFDNIFGGMNDRKYFPFGRGCRVQGNWWWHGSDMVYQKGSVKLEKGPAEIIIYKNKNEIPSAKRFVDFIFITSDLSITPGDDNHWKTTNILSYFTQPLYVKITSTTQSEKDLVYKVHTSLWLRGYYMGPRFDYYISNGNVSSKFNKNKTSYIKPGESTKQITLNLHTAMPSQLSISAYDKDGKIASVRGTEVELTKDKISIQKIVCQNDREEIIVPWGIGLYEEGLTENTEKIFTFDEILSNLLSDLNAFKCLGKKPKKFALITSLEPISERYLELISALGINGESHRTTKVAYDGIFRDYNLAGHLSFQNWHLSKDFYEGNTTGIENRYRNFSDKLKSENLWHIRQNIKLIEECGSPSCVQLQKWARMQNRFKEFLLMHSVEPKEIIDQHVLRKLFSERNIPSREELWKYITVGNGNPDEAIANPKLYYYSNLFRSFLFCDATKKATALVEKHFAPGSLTNSGSIYPSVGEFSGFKHGIDHFMIFREKAITAYFSEMSWISGGTPASLGAQTGSYEGALARAFSKYHNIPRETYLICDPNRGYTPQWVRLYAYSLVSQGITGLDLFSLALMECSAIGYPEMLKAIKEIAYTIGDIEDYLIEAEIPQAKVALGWSSSTDIWDESIPKDALPEFSGGNNIYPTERHTIYHALRHNQLNIDILSEDDVANDGLSNYSVYYLIGDHLTKAAAEKIKKWVKHGGTLVSVAGGGLFDNFNEPLDTLKEVYGIKDSHLEKATHWLRPKMELIFAKPIDVITFTNTELEGLTLDVFAYRQTFSPSTAEVWGKYENGKPAVLCNKYGEGKAIIFGTLPGYAYVRPAIPMMPYGRSAYTDLELSFFIPTNYSSDVRKIISYPVGVAKVIRNIETSCPLVEGTLMTCKQKNTILATLVNHSLKEISNLKVTIRLDGIKSIRSCKKGLLDFDVRNKEAILRLSLGEVDFLVIQK